MSNVSFSGYLDIRLTYENTKTEIQGSGNVVYFLFGADINDNNSLFGEKNKNTN